MLSKTEKYNFLSERAFTAGYDQSRATTSRRSHPVDAGIPSAIFGPRESFSRIALERSVRRSTILLPNHFRRLILQFEFARACARNHPLALSRHTSQQSSGNGRSIVRSLCDLFLPLLVAISLPLASLSLSLPPFTHCSLSRARSRSSLENMYRVAHGSVDKNNQV